jgi:16S rRNA (cytosine1402-N4)-methyltransferase
MHTPVLLNEVLEMLNPKPGEFVIDGTIGGGGHAREIMERLAPGGVFLGIDWDAEAIGKLQEELPGDRGLKRFVLKNGNYADLPAILKAEKLGKADGLLIDLGFSSDQLAKGRGFSFKENEPLIMTYSLETLPAYKVLRQLRKEEIVEMIKELSDERYSRPIGEAIWQRERKNPIETSGELREVIKNVVPKRYEGGRIDPATRTFQAIRIFVNDELGNLERLLKHIPEILNPGGRAVIVSYHSGEDRIAKNIFRDLAKEDIAEILTKKPIQATGEEVAVNPKSHSAKLRAIKLNDNTSAKQI